MRKILAVALAAAAIGSPLAAQSQQAHTDYSGTWALDAKTAPPGLTSLTLTVKQDEKTLNVVSDITSAMGAQKVTNVFALDGSESKNTTSGAGGSVDLLSHVGWEGANLIIATKGSMQGNEITQNEKWTLGGDGKTLQIDRVLTAGGQNFSVKLAFNKQ